MRKQYFRDALLSKTHILPAGASLTTTTDSLDLGLSKQAGSLDLKAQLLVEADALTTTQLPDDKTVTYDIYHDDDSTFATETIFAGAVVKQTGAGGAGAAAADGSVGLGSNVKRYVRAKATTSAAAGDCHAASFKLSVVF
jgi:hypothetical protein